MTIPASGADVISTSRKIATGVVTLTPVGGGSPAWNGATQAHGLGVRPSFIKCEIINSGSGWWRAQPHAVATFLGGQWQYSSTLVSITAQTVDGSDAALNGNLTVRWIAFA